MRDTRIDILRFIGLAMVILAHSNPPGFIAQLRNFDVPLMVLVSGMSFGLTYKYGTKYSSYIWERVKRLVFPVWIFLAIYFAILATLFPNNPNLNAKTAITSFSFISGIGYVWIIRVFLLVALISPFLYFLNRLITSDLKYMTWIAIFLFTSELFRLLTIQYLDVGYGYLLSQVTHYIIPYGALFAIGIRIPKLPLKLTTSATTICLILFISIAITLYFRHGEIISTQDYKYPPSAYYLSYAIFVSLLIWLLIDKIKQILEATRVIKLAEFCSKNSIWIYLWHIPLLELSGNNFIMTFLLVSASATSVCFLQIRLVELIISKTSNETFAKNVKKLFTG